MSDTEEYIFDTYDRIIDTNGSDDIMNEFEHGLSAEGMGMAFVLAEEMRDEERAYVDQLAEEIADQLSTEKSERSEDIDEETDKKNWEKVMKLASLQSRHRDRSKLRPFEQYIDDICKGRRGLFED